MPNPTIDNRIAKAKLDRIIGEIQSERTFLTCGQHGYVAYIRNGQVNPPAPRGCPDCWKAYYFTIHAMQAPEARYEHLQELEEVIRHTTEFAEKGKFGGDFELYSPSDPRFKVKIEKEK